LKTIVLEESDLWDYYQYFLNAKKYGYNVTFKTTEGEFVASFKRPTRASKGLPITEHSSKFRQNLYKDNGYKIPESLKEMRETLKKMKED